MTYGLSYVKVQTMFQLIKFLETSQKFFEIQLYWKATRKIIPKKSDNHNDDNANSLETANDGQENGLKSQRKIKMNQTIEIRRVKNIPNL